MLKKFILVFMAVFLFQAHGWADDTNPKNDIEKICNQLNSGGTDVTKLVGLDIAFTYDPSSYQKAVDGSIEFSSISSTNGKQKLNCPMILVQHPSFSSISSAASSGSCSITGAIKAVDASTKTITIDQAEVCSMPNSSNTPSSAAGGSGNEETGKASACTKYLSLDEVSSLFGVKDGKVLQTPGGQCVYYSLKNNTTFSIVFQVIPVSTFIQTLGMNGAAHKTGATPVSGIGDKAVKAPEPMDGPAGTVVFSKKNFLVDIKTKAGNGADANENMDKAVSIAKIIDGKIH